MSTITDPHALAGRARNLEANGLNGIARVFVQLIPPGSPVQAELNVTLFNALHRDDLVALGGDPADARRRFPIAGGIRVRAGSAEGQVRVDAVAPGSESDQLLLTVSPIGDYATYRLSIEDDRIDPVFSEIDFKFRPGCFSNDCAPEWEPGTPSQPTPSIDYMAKDYDSFRHLMISGMMDRVPGWQPTSEADLDQVLINLFAASADELSDAQDRVMAESRFATVRSRISLARHARLMDYHIHQGNQAGTLIALEIDPAGGGVTVPADQPFWTGRQSAPGIAGAVDDAIYFASDEEARLHPLFNALKVYTWDDAYPALAAGSTSADLTVDPSGLGMSEMDAAQFVVDCIRGVATTFPPLRRLLIQEWLNPDTGRPNGADPERRQVVRLLEGESGAELVEDPLHNLPIVRVRWRQEDTLRFTYPLTVFPAGIPVVRNVSQFHGNLMDVYHGMPRATVFLEPGESTDHADIAPYLEPGEILPADHIRRYHRTRDHRYGVLCPLPDGPLAYQATPPGGTVPPRSTVSVTVHTPGAGSDPWDEVITLLHSDDSPENGDRFVVETDELGRSRIRFGNGVNGRILPERAVVVCRYQVGLGADGNVGRDRIANTEFWGMPPTAVTRCWNPFDVENGRSPESPERIRRNAPEAFSARQLRAITPDDYARRAEEVEGVNRARAFYRWTGSWRTVRVSIDPEGTTALADDLRSSVSAYLEAVRLVGEDLELRAPHYVPLAIFVRICVKPDVWPEDLRFVLEQEFSDNYTPNGRRAFFHPDNWTFGQRLRRSELAGRIKSIPGVGHVQGVHWTRFNEPTPGVYDQTETGPEEIFVGDNEIIMVHNDPDFMERGFIRFILNGGRR